MQVPVEVRFHNVMRSDAVEQAVRERAEKLEKFVPDIVSCRVTVECAHNSKRKGNTYGVRVDVRFPGVETVVSHGGGEDPAHEDVFVAVRDAFDAVRRQLEDRVRVRRGDVKLKAARRGERSGAE
jgi:ribosomal subunit interface protein